ncbi:hypothetical protein EGW08_016685 [Elysia chlorotica]|uniref:Ig-like domain-containing protein n=1 Tax=Elysia chlorotica TaxID=188477 RepID=A0A433T241_ELYCH|nr:hypothetical protein EGW08_016685 [Elysia chlorotica]
MAWARLFHGYAGLVRVLALLACFQQLSFGFPFKALNAPEEPTKRRYELHKKRGDRVKIQCDAFVVGFSRKVKVVWALRLRRLSHAGCNPKDPAMTLVELIHTNGSLEEHQIYRAIKEPPKWKIYARGAALNKDLTNIWTAWVGLAIAEVEPQDSGIYRCDALVGELDDSLSKTSRSSYTTLTVSVAEPAVGHIHPTPLPLDASLTATDYDRSVLNPSENHQRPGGSVNISCVPRLLARAPMLPFSVSSIEVQFLPFHLPDSDFITVSRYQASSDRMYTKPPPHRNWLFSNVGTRPEFDRSVDSLHMRIDIRIPAVTKEETGIFRCSVTDGATNAVYSGEAGLKVSDESDFRSGFCETPKYETDDVISKQEEKFGNQIPDIAEDLGLQADAMVPEGVEDATHDLWDNPTCMVAIILVIICVVLLILLILLAICMYIGYCLGCWKRKAASHEPTSEQPLGPGQTTLDESNPDDKKKKKKKKKNLLVQVPDRSPSPFTLSQLDFLAEIVSEYPCIPLKTPDTNERNPWKRRRDLNTSPPVKTPKFV